MKARTPTPLFEQAHIAPLRALTPTPLQRPSKDGRLSTPYEGEGTSGTHPFSLGERGRGEGSKGRDVGLLKEGRRGSGLHHAASRSMSLRLRSTPQR